MMAKVTWLGDADPSKQVITVGDLTFVKGEAVNVPDKHPSLAKLKGNPSFTTDAKAEAVKSDEPEAPDPDEGTELAALRAEADRLGVKYAANASADTIRGNLAKAAG